jgi:large subunit ribosomal protein L30
MPNLEPVDKVIRDQKATVLALGLRRMHQTIEHRDNPALRGMIQKVIHLVKVEE